MVMSDTKIYQNMKNKSFLTIEKKIIKKKKRKKARKKRLIIIIRNNYFKNI